jgi:hypothetical protein
MKLLIAGIAAGLATAGASLAQDIDDVARRVAPRTAGDDPFELKLKLEPRFNIDGDDLPSFERRDIEADGEYSLEGTLTHTFANRTNASLSPSLTASPHWFDSSPARSAASLGARVEHSFDQRRGDGKPGDSILVYANVEAGWRWNRFFDDEGARDQTYEVGSTATDLRAWLCGERQRRLDGNCDGDKGLRYAYTASYSVVTSSDPDREFEGPSIGVALRSPIWRSSAIDVELGAQRRTYAHLFSDGGTSAAEADRYSAAVRFTISGFAHRIAPSLRDFKVQVGFKWVVVDADRGTLDGNEFSFIPTVTRTW